MKTYIALLRGINLGAKKRILMADLRQLFMELGFDDVKTYIHTGNVIFKVNDNENILEIESRIEKAILSQYGFDVTVIIRSKDELEKITLSNPFKDKGDVDRFHMTFLKNTPNESEEYKIKNDYDGEDDFKIIDNNIYVYCSKLYMDTKLGNNFFEKHLNVGATTRNWKVTLKLLELANK